MSAFTRRSYLFAATGGIVAIGVGLFCLNRGYAASSSAPSDFVVKAASGLRFNRVDVTAWPAAEVPDYKRKQFNLLGEIEEDLKFPSGREHTMVDLDGYCQSKIFLHRDTLQELIKRQGYKIEVQGVYPEHVKVWAEGRGWAYNENSLLSYGKSKERLQIEKVLDGVPRKRYNTERPQWYAFPEEKRLVLAVFPGRDYTKHFGHIIRHYMAKQWGEDVAKAHFLGAFYYPDVIESVAEWTKLKKFVGDLTLSVVVLGYVDELHDTLVKFDQDVVVVEQEEIEPWQGGSIYGKQVVQNALKNRIVFLGVTHSYWGETSKYIVKALYEAGAQEVIYAAKCGTLSEETYVLGVTVPSQFKLVQLAGGTAITPDIPTRNSMEDLVKGAPVLDERPMVTGIHVSVPDIVSESQRQYTIVKRYGGDTVDNEISYMASVVPPGRRFSVCHFITDHLKSSKELSQLEVDPRFDLTKMAKRTPEAEELVSKAKNRVRELVMRHIRFWTPLISDPSAIRGCWPEYGEVSWTPYIAITKTKLVINVSYLKNWVGTNAKALEDLFRRGVTVEVYLPDPDNEEVMQMLRRRFWYKNSFNGPENVRGTVSKLEAVRQKAGGKGSIVVYYVPYLQSYSLYVFDDSIAIHSVFSEANGEIHPPSPVVIFNLDHKRIKEFCDLEIGRLKVTARNVA